MLKAGSPELNFILETINGVVLILSFPLLIVLTIYIISKIRQQKQPLHQALVNAPNSTVLALALALYLDKVGVLVTRVAVWTWRHFGDGLKGGPMNDTQVHALLAGTALSAVGLLWLIGILSRPRYGNGPWLACITVTAIYLISTCTRHLIGAD